MTQVCCGVQVTKPQRDGAWCPAAPRRAYSSNLTKWRKQMTACDPNALEPRKRDPKRDPLRIEYETLLKRNQKREEELKRAKMVIDVQKTLRPAGTADNGRAGGEMILMQGVARLILHFGIKASCSLLNVPRANYNRWTAGRKSTSAAIRNVRSNPPRSLDDSEIKQMEETLSNVRLADQSARAIYAAPAR
jgi:hypothetical protein